MSETTVSRSTLRRAIGHEARMPFYRTYADYEVTVTGGPDTDATRDSVPDSNGFYASKLTQGEDDWRGGFAYVASDTAGASNVGEVGEERPIASFNRKNSHVTVSYPFDVALELEAKVELLSMWSAKEVHNAINKAIRLGGRAFSDMVEDDTTFCVVRDWLQYDLSSMAVAPRRILGVDFEQTSSELSGSADSIAATTVECSEWVGQLSDVNANWIASVYDGTGKGQTRNVVSADDDSGTITVATWATNPDTTSKLKLWNGDSQVMDWDPVLGMRFDAREYPNYLRLIQLHPAFEGRRIRIKFEATPAALDADSETTVVNEDYIVHKALSILHDQLVGDNKYNQNKHANLAEYHDQLAAGIKAEFMRRKPQRRMTFQYSDRRVAPYDDPLGFYGG